MNGERVPATRYMGGSNNPHKFGHFSGGCHTGFGTLGPRRTVHNKVAKRQANAQRRRLDRKAIRESFMSE